MSSKRRTEFINTSNEPKKDEEELALEKLVFGDAEGFELSLRDLDLENFLNEKNEDDLSDPEATDDEKEEEDATEDVAGLDDAQLFFVDDDVAMTDASINDASSTDSSEEDDDDILDVNGGRAAWIDSDDERLEISLVDSNRLKKLRKNAREDVVTGKEYVKRLRTRFEKIYPVPLWAQEKVEYIASEDEDEDMESDDDAPISSDPLAKLLQSTSRYVSNDKTKLLPSGVIDVDRLKDANQAAVSIGAVQSLQFHPTHPLLLTSGYDKTLRLFHVDGKKNPLVTTLHISRSPLHTALFHPDGVRVFAGGKRKHLHIWNIETGNVIKFTNFGGNDQFHRDTRRFKISPCGRFLALIGSEGWVSILSCNNGQWITSVKIEGSVADLTWFSEGKGLALLNTSGDVWEWDSSKRQFTGRWKDEGGVGSSTIALGGKDDRWCAVGSNSGIVNVYDRQSLQGGIVSSEGEPLSYKPRATLKQLVTAITTLEFSPDGQMLVMASKDKKDAFKLVHVPSFTVFKNWPTTVTPFGRVTSFGFTPGGEYMSINTREEALAALKLLPINRLAFQVIKIDTEDAIKANLKPKAGVPCLQINPNQGFEDDFYYCWFYEPVSITTYLYAGLALGVIFAVVLFPLWPLVMRKGVWYLSMAFLGLIASFFGIALIRLVLFCVTYIVLKPGIWIFPNLFEDVGIVESFIPFWAWHGVDTMAMHKPKKRISKKKKLAKLEKKKAQEAAAQQATQQAANGKLIQDKLQGINAKLVAIAEERAKAGNPISPAEIQALGQKLLAEELGPNFQLQMGPPPSQNGQNHSHEHGHDHSHENGHSHSHGGASDRIVVLEDDEEK